MFYGCQEAMHCQSQLPGVKPRKNPKEGFIYRPESKESTVLSNF